MQSQPKPNRASPSFQDIQQAFKNLNGSIVKTPFQHSRTLSGLCGADVWLKFENHQFTASFKERGALNKLLSLSDEEKARGIIAMSAGNHAQGVAYHCQRLGIPATIIMPRYTPLNKVRHTRNFGATVELAGDNVDESYAVALERIKEKDLVLVHPYDDPEATVGLPPTIIV